MTFSLEYHVSVTPAVKGPVQRSVPASLSLFGILLLPLLLVSSSPGQINAATTSSSAHSVAATTPSVTAPASHTAVSSKPDAGLPTKPHPPKAPTSNGPTNNGTQPRGSYYPYIYVVPMPYAVDATGADAPAADNNDDNSNSDNDSDPDYQGGPTIFDRRGSGAASYVPPVTPPAEASVEEAQADEPSAAYSDPDPPQAPTILVFKDGHQLAVANYAIVGQTLFDLTPGHPRKVALADLDLPATEKQNDDHGVAFELPSAQAN